MRVAGRDAATVVDAGVIAVAANPAGDRDRAAPGGADRRAGRDPDIDARVQVAPAHPERRHDRTVDGPDEAAASLADRADRRTPSRALKLRGDLCGELREVTLELVPALPDVRER